jgi:hypothetical protein
MPFEPHQSSSGCITNIRRRLPACDRVIADYKGHGLADAQLLRPRGTLIDVHSVDWSSDPAIVTFYPVTAAPDPAHRP